MDTNTGDKLVKLPPEGEIATAIYHAEFYHAPSAPKEHFQNFAAVVAGKELTGYGLMRAWELSIHDTLSDDPFMASIARLYFPFVIDLIVTDKEVAEAAKAEHTKFLIEVSNSS
jgi:hypothetical protein